MTPVLAIALLPKLMRPLGDLFFETHVFVHVKNRVAVRLVLRLFHYFSLVVIVRSSLFTVFDSKPGNLVEPMLKTCPVAGPLFCLRAQFGRTIPNPGRYELGSI